MYVHGLGDAQEDAARHDEINFGWMRDIKIKCPKCGSFECDWEEFDENGDEDGVEYIFKCWCNQCDHTFEHYN